MLLVVIYKHNFIWVNQNIQYKKKSLVQHWFNNNVLLVFQLGNAKKTFFFFIQRK